MSISLRMERCWIYVTNATTGVRQALGLFLAPITQELGWSRSTFSLAIAINNLMLGIASPVFGMLADKLGSAYVLLGLFLTYALGLFLSSIPNVATFIVFQVRDTAGCRAFACTLSNATTWGSFTVEYSTLN